MTNLLFGILTIIFCSIGYFYSWKCYTKENFKTAILLLIMCGFILRFYSAADFYVHDWDERYHALVSKNLIKHPLVLTLYDQPILPGDNRNWKASHIWLHKQPLPLWSMAASMWIFGINEIALRLPSIILTTIGIWLTFSIGAYFFNNQVGFLAAFLYSVNGLIIAITAGRVATDHIDSFFLFFIELAVFFSIAFAQKKKVIYNVLAGVSVGAAILSKWLPALIVLPIWLLIVIDSKNFKPQTIIFQFILLLVITILIFLPWQFYIYQAFTEEARWESSYNFRHITEVVENHGASFYYYLDGIRINQGELIYLPLLWFVWKTIKNPGNLKRLAICIWFLIPFLFFSFIKTKMQAYILFVYPTLFIMTAEFWHMLKAAKENAKLKWLINLILLLLIALPVRYAIEKTKVFANRDRKPQWVSQLKELNKADFHHGVMFNYNKPIEAMFYTNLTVYPGIPDKTVILNLLENGYVVIVNDNGLIPENIKSIKGIRFEHLNLSEP